MDKADHIGLHCLLIWIKVKLIFVIRWEKNLSEILMILLKNLKIITKRKQIKKLFINLIIFHIKKMDLSVVFIHVILLSAGWLVNHLIMLLKIILISNKSILAEMFISLTIRS